MDDITPVLVPDSPLPVDQGDTAHINQELYKRNLELAIKNKTLSILSTLYEITMSSLEVTEVSQRIVDTLGSELNLAVVLINLVDKENNLLRPVAITQTVGISEALGLIGKTLPELTTPLDYKDNLEIMAIIDMERKITGNLLDILIPATTQEVADKVEMITGIKTIIVYPLILKDKDLGTLDLGINKKVEDLSRAERDTIEEVIDLVTIALDRAQLHGQLQQVNEQLKLMDKKKDEFVSVASHELRTPMTAIKSYLWLAMSGRGGPLSDKQKYYLDRSYQSTERLIRLVNNMLNVSRIESGRIVLELSVIEINKLIEDVITEVKPRADELSLFLSTPLQTAGIAVKVDIDRMKEVFINLIGNSLKFTPKGGTITVSTELKDQNVVIHVIDTGPGLTPEEMSQLFQKFGLIKDSYVTNQNISMGTGLGLYISKSIVELHGGTIWVESEGRGKGTTFSFTLPISKPVIQ